MRCNLLTLGMAIFLSTAAHAQQWSSEQEETIDHVRACWEAWGQEDVNVWDGACLTDSGARNWWMVEGVPSYGPAEWKRWAEAFFPRIEALVHFEQRPIAVQIFGDVALYQFWATWTHVDANGQVVTMNERHLDVLQRRNGRWIFIGGAGAPVPQG